MRKRFRIFHLAVIMIAALMVACGVAVAQEDITEVDDSGFANRIRPAAVFYHEDHNEMAELDCAVCHHVYEDGELLEDETSEDSECSECHGNSDDPRNLDLVVTYHNRCKGCHEEEKSGPVVCSECHVK
jgi:hypothetical protein